MSDLSTVVDHLVDVSTSTDDVDAVVAAMEYLEASGNAEVTPEELAEMFQQALSHSDSRSLLYSMEQANIVTDEGLDRERLDIASGAAKTAVATGRRPENDVVVNVPQGDNPDIGKSLGSLVVRLVELIASAQEEILILNPFFTEQAFGNVVRPVVNALDRGVTVTLVTRYLTYGSDEDSREFVREVSSERQALGGELELYEYINPEEESTATIHTKMTIVDRERAYLGTANLTHRGLHDNLEVGVIFRDDTVSQFVNFADELRESRYLHRVELRDDEFVRV
ncbi:phosphatidylserine/phosphatidylglycerophosphate/cardiolipin synthase family protein [Haloarcula sp. CBA1131]|uniref:phospholipase D family protein n=1 Tax=Haloarcula sp. CBA1131 TaxID=1853686 RepID=UPI00124715D3|nr:phosphatidylserine/phosphatidylglycerophosphate/cardiolipin synthase family protein [Haloarcula sp. CBA1131]KAA9400783.1 phosphatidylserine/phosphatidylglycerophosphate/cardiolipin synthase family protein [Haloarcula sp. CBA1131]KAA9404119.1 phosphatidylserine/phosphatidylglycerophosphate/cardiolipin synthase family protein [Haloarcula sp. CBA1131]